MESEFYGKMKWICNVNDDIYDPTYTDMLRVAFTSEFGRITSYNVCYTKLLRSHGCDRPSALLQACVGLVGMCKPTSRRS